MSLKNKIPRAVINRVADAFQAMYSAAHTAERLSEAGAPGTPPQAYPAYIVETMLSRCNMKCSEPLVILGHLLEDLMEGDDGDNHIREMMRVAINKTLKDSNLAYKKGGDIGIVSYSTATKSLEQMLRERDFPSVELEFQRALDNAASDPGTAITAACAIIEAMCKVYIHDNNLEPPKDKSVSPLWQVVKKHLKLDPKDQADYDLRKIMGGLGSVVEGLGALRTHIGNAHGQGKTPYPVHPRHARLAINAAHSLAVFVFEVWEQNQAPDP